ncbi:hypothetical protein PINS_up007075 [Pythium insidiosum]|nr:hypothetical protein PINS_up007075 [Pythium insidiosum]
MRLHSNRYVEVLLYIGVPLAAQLVFSPKLTRRVLRRAKALVVGSEDAGFVFREVESRTTYGKSCVEDSADYEHQRLLQRAISTYLADVLNLNASDVTYQLMEKPVERIIELQRSKSLSMLVDDASSNAGTEKDDDDYDSDDGDGKLATYQELLKLRVGSLPAENSWVKIEPGIFFRHIVYGNGENDDEDPQDTSQNKTVSVVFQFKTDLPNGTQVIDRLVRKALIRFQRAEIVKAATDKARYMYVQTLRTVKAASSDDGDGGDKSAAMKTAVVYKRYALSDAKSFKTLFFEDKAAVIQLLDAFQSRSGKFAIKGFPYKLGFLLHGPPGTGKTSMIKAIAQYTKRHVVTISLAKIQTNQQLMNAVFDLRFKVEGKDMPVNLKFEDIIFVLEDIDCASAIVNSRENSPTKQTRRPSISSSPGLGPFSLGDPLSASSSSSDKLNLSGLLNVLDGVIDCPGRIVIMTTNHPEKLDPALIRPGRVNKKLLLSYMPPSQIVLMLEHYFATKLTSEQRRVVSEDCAALKVTPAEVEELCAEHWTIDDVLKALREFPLTN